MPRNAAADSFDSEERRGLSSALRESVAASLEDAAAAVAARSNDHAAEESTFHHVRSRLCHDHLAMRSQL